MRSPPPGSGSYLQEEREAETERKGSFNGLKNGKNLPLSVDLCSVYMHITEDIKLW